jgi:Double zinc ribbon
MAREIKVFCPEHQAAFEVEAKPQLVCEIREHSLSVDFPQAEFWQYCCDCQTFSVNDFETNGSVKANCLHCERTTTRLFLCSNCKTVCYDSDEDTRGKITTVNFGTGVSPNCPACEIPPDGKVFLHHCDSVKAVLLTLRADCPFCLKPTEIKVIKLTAETTIVETGSRRSCPQCLSLLENDAVFCTECGYKFLPQSFAETSPFIPKVEVINAKKIYCTKCLGENLEGSEFCGDCGTTLILIRTDEKPAAKPNTFNPVIYIVAGMGVISLLIIVVAINSNKSITPASNNATNITSGQKSLTLTSTPNKSNSDFRIGKKGTLSVDTNLRKHANKDAELLGTHYAQAKVEILDVDSTGSQTWFKIKVLSYGKSLNPEQYGKTGKDMNSEDVGWVNSFPLTYDENKKGRRIDLIQFE